jgi:hypothetical protein
MNQQTKTTNLFVAWIVFDEGEWPDIRVLLDLRAAGYDIEVLDGLDHAGIEGMHVYARIELATIDEGWEEGDGPWQIADYPIMYALLQQLDSIVEPYGGGNVAQATFRNPTPVDWRYRPEV